MKLYAPEYYKDFVCIADKCNHSCCVGWEIDIDAETADKYAALDSGYGKKIKESIDFSDVPCFKLGENERCPHLDGKGLCRIILELGEDHLCDICREHPRFYNATPAGREVGLGMACEEACRIILGSDSFSEFYLLDEWEADEEEWEFDPLFCRNEIYKILGYGSLGYRQKIRLIEEEFRVFVSCVDAVKRNEILEELEYLDPEHKQLFVSSNVDGSCDVDERKLERALAYFVYRHCSGAYDADEFCASLGFSLFCTELVRALASNGIECENAARIVSEEIEYSEDNTEMIKEKLRS